MDGNGSVSSQVNVLVEERVVSNKGAVYPNVYIFGYDHKGKEEVYDYLESVVQDKSGPKFAVNLVEGSMTRSGISKKFSTAIKKIRTNMKTEDTSAFLMVMNPNIYSVNSTEKGEVTQLLRVIGPEILKRCVLVLIGGDELLRQKLKLTNHYDEVVRKQWCMCDLYEQVFPRIIAIDISETPPFVKSRQNDQILSLLLAAGSKFDKTVSKYWIIVALTVAFFLGICVTVLVLTISYFILSVKNIVR